MRRAAAAIVFGAALTAAALAIAASPRGQAMIDSTVRFMQEHQRPDGGFAEPGGEPSQSINAWVALALASAGINPQDQARCGTDLYTFLVAHFQAGLEEEEAWPQIATTAFERELLVVDAAGTDPHDFAGYDLVGQILGRQLADGSFPYGPEGEAGGANDTIFAILALSPIHEPAVEKAIAAAREWVVGAQDEDGGWYYSGKSAVSEVDMTGAALQALVVAGPPAAEPALAAYRLAEEEGLEYLRKSQLPDGGFPALPTSMRESNVASTAWAVQGIWATGGNPETWNAPPDGREPLDYLESMQQPDGHIRWQASTDMNGIWMTAYVTPAFAGQAWPIPSAPRAGEATRQSEAAACLKSGDEEGVSPEAPQHPEESVIAGGGGHHAPAFSRPKAQSKGRTPGGARVVRGHGLKARNHSPDRRRGANVDQARGTESVEPQGAVEADQDVEEVSAGPAGTSSDTGAGGDGGDRKGRGDRGAPVPVELSPHAEPASGGEEVSGVVIGSPDGDEKGKLAYGAPGLRSAGAGALGEPWTAIGIAGAALLAALLGAGWERRQGRLA
jgi:prenyltransferase beta subunit